MVLTSVFFFTVACGKGASGDCPGLCPVENTNPTMTIEVAGGAAAIASAKVISGPCSHLLVHSDSEAGAPTRYATAQITYNGPADIPPLCLIQLTSIAGDTQVVTATVTATSDQQPCCPLGSCCPAESAITIHPRVVFDQPVQTISFPIRIGLGLDGGEVDAALDAENNAMDAGLDAGAVD